MQKWWHRKKVFITCLDPSVRPHWLERPAGGVYADDFPQVIFLRGTSLFYTSLLCLSCCFNDKEQDLKPQARSSLPNSLFYSMLWHSGISTGTAHTSLPVPPSLPRFYACDNMPSSVGWNSSPKASGTAEHNLMRGPFKPHPYCHIFRLALTGRQVGPPQCPDLPRENSSSEALGWFGGISCSRWTLS